MYPNYGRSEALRIGGMSNRRGGGSGGRRSARSEIRASAAK
jgi:hypothetical protein